MQKIVCDIPEMYSEMMILMKMQGQEESSRNGTVLTLPEPLLVTVCYPLKRVLTDPTRCANPFFHVMEFVWMMAGSDKLEWIQQYNKGFKQYAEEDGRFHGAYGYRWREHFCLDQIQQAVEMLRRDPSDRRVVIGMWDPETDMGAQKKDLPCNTHIYLRIVDEELDFTVCNRSNDVIWGMTGANAVHMTMLQELMANALGVDVGKYRVFTNNAHVYTELPNVEKMLETTHTLHVNYVGWRHVKLLQPNEPLHTFLHECQAFVQGDGPFANKWLAEVAAPVKRLWHERTEYGDIADSEWEQACSLWLQRKP